MVKEKRKVEIDEAAEVQDKVFIAKGKKQKVVNFDVEDSEDEIPAIQK
jgi:prolyl-tRNA editing enzyme YbaK/EbsC (Cys-tRNA(Pro) deacylase)